MIGVYDSGVGGMAIMREALKLEPDLGYIYFLYKDFLPLGDKTLIEIKNRMIIICEYLFNRGCDLVILACNTASVNSIRYIQQEYLPKFYPDKKVLGVTKPLIEYMEEEFGYLQNKKGLFLATKATCESGFYQKEFKLKGFNYIEEIPMIGLAESIEHKDIIQIKNILHKKSLQYQNYDYAILACTHYTYVKSEIKTEFGLQHVIDPTEYTANKLIQYLYKHYEKEKFLTKNRKLLNKI